MASPSPAERVISWFSRLRGRGSPPPSIPALPRTFNERYRLEELLGRGGTGAVYRARDTHTDRIVAVKLVRTELLADESSRQRFREDAETLGGLHHPSIVAIFDSGTFPQGGGYLVMEVVRGEDLRRVLQREGRLEPDSAIRILSLVCNAVEAAHRAGVLHRDLKPENILLPEHEEVRVLDFGIRPAVLSAGAVIMGTPPYMAPELFRGGPFDARCDVFSLGVLAYEMLEGELPFGGGTLGEIVLAHAHDARPMRTSSSVPSAVERAVRTALDANPDRRPSSAQAFAHLLAASQSFS